MLSFSSYFNSSNFNDLRLLPLTRRCRFSPLLSYSSAGLTSIIIFSVSVSVSVGMVSAKSMISSSASVSVISCVSSSYSVLSSISAVSSSVVVSSSAVVSSSLVSSDAVSCGVDSSALISSVVVSAWEDSSDTVSLDELCSVSLPSEEDGVLSVSCSSDDSGVDIVSSCCSSLSRSRLLSETYSSSSDILSGEISSWLCASVSTAAASVLSLAYAETDIL